MVIAKPRKFTYRGKVSTKPTAYRALVTHSFIQNSAMNLAILVTRLVLILSSSYRVLTVLVRGELVEPLTLNAPQVIFRDVLCPSRALFIK